MLDAMFSRAAQKKIVKETLRRIKRKLVKTADFVLVCRVDKRVVHFATIFFASIKYFFLRKPYEVGYLDIWVGQKCTLKCKDCVHLIPYIEQKHFDIDEVIASVEKLTKLCVVRELHVVGGEPFTHPHLDKFLSYLNTNKNIKTFELVTNGSIIPKPSLLEVMKKCSTKISVGLSPYRVLEKAQKKFEDFLIEHEIKWRHAGVGKWHTFGEATMERNNNDEEMNRIFLNCAIRGAAYTLHNNILSMCCRGTASIEAFKSAPDKIEQLEILKVPSNFIGKALVSACLSHYTTKEYCHYCTGGTSGEMVEAGLQLKSRTKFANSGGTSGGCGSGGCGSGGCGSGASEPVEADLQLVGRPLVAKSASRDLVSCP